MDFAQKLLSHHSSIFIAIPYLLLVAAAVGLQYLQMSRLNARNPQASQANPQAAMLQKYMPLIFGFIYLNVAAILNVYFIISSGIRILTQEILFRKGLVAGPPAAAAAGAGGGGKKGPAVDRTERALPKAGAGGASAKSGGAAAKSGGAAKAGTTKAGGSAKADGTVAAGGSNGSRRPATGSKGTAGGKAGSAAKATGPTNGSNGRRSPTAGQNGSGTSRNGAKSSSNGSNGSGDAAADEESADQPKEHPRSKAKRERKAR